MRENEFERKVQEQMEELRIRPSDETWERVEKELREKKKRRAAVLFFIMAGLLLLGYSGYTFLNRSFNQPVAQNEIKKSSSETIQPTGNTPASTINTTTHNNPAVAEKSETTPNTNQPYQNKNANPSLIRKTDKEDPVTTLQTSQKENRQLPDNANPGKLKGASIVRINADNRQQKKNAGTRQKDNNSAVLNSTETAISRNSLDQTERNQEQQPVDKKDDIISNGIVSNTINPKQQISAGSVSAIDSTVAKTEVNGTQSPITEEPTPAIAKNNNKSNWKFGVEVSGGLISSQSEVFGFINVSEEKSLRNQFAAGNAGIPTNGSGITPPSDVKAGKSFKIGLVTEKAISKRSSLSAGLRYSYADESLVVGAIRDTMIRSSSYSVSQNFFAFSGVRNAYSPSALAAPPASPTNYTNRYHFLEIPLLYQTQLNKGKKVGVLWNAGIVPGLLIGTNALVYDTVARGVYYKNDKAFKKFHINMQTGFALQFGNNKKIQWSLGPTISLDMTRLMKEDVFTEKRYFLYTGLSGRVFLNSRKK